METLRTSQKQKPWNGKHRRGAIILLAAGMMVMIFAFAAFSIDVGYIALTKNQLQNAADSGALAAALELPDSYGPGAPLTADETSALGRDAASAMAAAHRNGNMDQTEIQVDQDVRFGHRSWNPISGSWEDQWDVQPYNMVEVTLHRAHSRSNELPLFFAPVIGVNDAELTVKSKVMIKPGVGVRIPPGSKKCADVLPIALDLPTWNALLAGVGKDQWNYNPDTGAITPGADGILEVDLYPNGTTSLPPGNRGTVDLGSSNNSTADLSRQILYGLNAYDLSFFPNNEIRTDKGPIYLNGDTGLSAGIKDELAAIKGQPRLIPIFTAVSGPGNNATYTVIKFVGIRILDVKLTGSPSQKRVTVQPAPFIDDCIITVDGPMSQDSYFGGVQLSH